MRFYRKELTATQLYRGITATDMLVAVLDRADLNLREIEKILSEMRAMLCLAREHIESCAIGVIAVALTRHVTPNAYAALTDPHRDPTEPEHLLFEDLRQHKIIQRSHL